MHLVLFMSKRISVERAGREFWISSRVTSEAGGLGGLYVPALSTLAHSCHDCHTSPIQGAVAQQYLQTDQVNQTCDQCHAAIGERERN